MKIAIGADNSTNTGALPIYGGATIPPRGYVSGVGYYPNRDFTLEEKRAEVIDMLHRGEARIVYYPDEDFVDVELTT